MATATTSPYAAGDLILQQLGITNPTAAQRRMVAAWVQAEGGTVESSTAGGPANNPLNTTQRTSSANVPLPVNGSVAGAPSIPAFSSLEAGAQAAAATLAQSPYSGVVSALKAGNTAQFSTALHNSPWASGHYGDDPLAIAKIAQGLAAPPAKVTTAPQSAVQKLLPGGQQAFGSGLGSAASAVGGAASGAAGAVAGGLEAAGGAVAAIPGTIASIATGWVKDIASWIGHYALLALVTIILSVLGLWLIAQGAHEALGTPSPGEAMRNAMMAGAVAA